jgi:hypothetical protein
MRNQIMTFGLLAILLCAAAHASAATIVPVSQQFTIDSDGDGTVDLSDNAPGAFNNQADMDADGIGDVIDPTPSLSNPFLGDPGLGVYAPPSIPPGGSASLPYVLLTTPPGAWGQIVLDFDLDNIVDAVYFGPLSTSIDTLTIPASLYVGSTWDLYTPGTYTVGMKAWAPGMQSQNWAYPNVTVEVPEPTSLVLAACGAGFAMLLLRLKRSS